MIDRVLEPEIMEDLQEAIEYNDMDFSEVNRAFVTDFVAYAKQDGFELGKDILDLGTGTARIPVELCVQVPSVRVMASDASTQMLELARYNIEIHHMLDRIQLHRGDAKKLVFGREFFDAVISNSLVHHLPECESFFAESLRVLRPSGVLFVRDLFRPESKQEVERLVVLHAGTENERSQQLFRQSLEAALTIQELAELLSRLGIESSCIRQSSDRHWTVAYRKPA
ncbi:MAG: class I SAM-dependent methyltransferase [Pirellula sp.]